MAQMMEVIRNKQQWNDEFALIAIRVIDELVRKRERVSSTNHSTTAHFAQFRRSNSLSFWERICPTTTVVR